VKKIKTRKTKRKRKTIPLILTNVLQTLYQLIDTFWVGRLGSKAVAAVSASFPILFFISSFGIGLTATDAIFVSQYKGSNNKRGIYHITTQTLIISFIISIILTIIGILLTNPILKLMHLNSSVFLMSSSYLKISFIGIIFMFSTLSFQSLMRGIGEVKLPLYLIALSVLLNLILDPLFIFGYKIIPPFGVSGAALATIFTQSISAIIGLIIMLNGKYEVKLNLKELKIDLNLIKRMLKIGFPNSIEQSQRAFGMVIFTFLVSSFGTRVLAAYGIGIRILSFIIIPAMGISIATSTLIGQNIGAKKIERAEKTAKISSITTFITLTLLGIILFIFAKQVATFFLPKSQPTVAISTEFIKIISLIFGFISFQMVLNGVFRGSGNTLISMSISIISFWLLRLPIAYVLSKLTPLKVEGLWLAFPIASIITATITLILFLKGDWKKKRIIHPTDMKN